MKLQNETGLASNHDTASIQSQQNSLFHAIRYQGLSHSASVTGIFILFSEREENFENLIIRNCISSVDTQ